MRRLLPAALSAIALLAAAKGSAELVVFEDGRHLHVSTYEVTGDRVALSLPGGGRMTLPLDVVDRIVDEEVEPAPQSAPKATVVPAPARARSVREMAHAQSFPHSAYDVMIFSASKEHRIDPALIAAVIRAESNFAPHAISRKGARGLMQLMPATARRLGVRRTFDPKENIRGGTRYLAELAERFGETAVERIVAAYNAGERAVEEHGGVPPYRETRDYVRRVIAFWEAAHAVSTASVTTVSTGEGGPAPSGAP